MSGHSGRGKVEGGRADVAVGRQTRLSVTRKRESNINVFASSYF